MRAVVQRVHDARVEVREAVVGSIDSGLLVYLAVGRDDTESDVSYVSSKILGLRIFPDAAGKMNLSLRNLVAEHHASEARPPGILVVSQFTLYGNVAKGSRPSFNDAAPPIEAERLYRLILTALTNDSLYPEAGIFGEHMDVTCTNDGPVTILIDSYLRR